MRYPILIEAGSPTAAFGVVVPDLPGCFSAGESLDEAIDAAKEAAAAWIASALDRGTPIPPPSSLDAAGHLPEYQGWILRVMELDAVAAARSSRI